MKHRRVCGQMLSTDNGTYGVSTDRITTVLTHSSELEKSNISTTGGPVEINPFYLNNFKKVDKVR